jgi:sugar phosphate isomerase/epimerase
VKSWKYSICNESFEGWPLERMAKFVADLGYEGVEVAPYTLCKAVTDLGPKQREQIRHTFERAGIAVSGLHWILAKTEGFMLNGTDPLVRERTKQYLLALIDFCADIGGSMLVFGSPAQRNIQPGFAKEEAWKNMLDAMYRCGVRSQQRGVVFCIEPLNGKDINIVHGVDEAAELVRQVNHPGFQLMVDVKSMARDSRPIPDQIRSVAPYMRHVHVQDPNLKGPGMGDLDFRPILKVLWELRYDRYVSVETFDFTPGPETLARESIQNMRAAEPQA